MYIIFYNILYRLYPTCEWDQKIITRLINDKKLAPRHKGTQVEQPETEECPICFLVSIFEYVSSYLSPLYRIILLLIM